MGRGNVSKLGALRGVATALAGLCWAHASGAAASFELNVTCVAWTSERVAQVEARIQASLLLDRRGARSVGVLCHDDTVSVEVATDEAALARPVVVRQGRTLEDDVVDAVERALRELQLPAAPAPESAPLDVAAPAAAPEPPLQEPVPRPAPRTPTSAPPVTPPEAEPLAMAELQVAALLERWSERWTWGAEAGLSVGERQLQYGLVVAGRVATGEPSSFDVNEWSSAARVQLTPRAALGLRGSLGVGASLFVTTPSSDVTAESGTLLATPFLELTISRPVWLGRFAISPLVGARFFSGSRRVRVNDAEALLLPLIAPQVSLALLWALPARAPARSGSP